MKVRVRDQQYYEKQTEADVEITVNRNQQSPFFLGTYAREIPENTPLYTSILQVAARDSDMRVCYSCIECRFKNGTSSQIKFPCSSVVKDVNVDFFYW